MSLDLALTLGGMIYGAALIWTMFVRNKVTEALRLDTLFIPNASEGTRPLNLGFGILALGYNIYALFRDYLLR